MFLEKLKPKGNSPQVIVLTIPSEEKSARKLGFDTRTYFYDKKELYPNTLFVRWGNSTKANVFNPIFDLSGEYNRVLNNYQFVRDNCNKKQSLIKLSQVVKTPKLFSDKIPKGAIAVYRPLEHTAGKDFKLIKGPFKVKPEFCATQLIKTNREYRVFVCGNKTLTCTRIPDKKEKYIANECRSEWNYGNIRKSPKRLHKLCLKAARTLNLEVGCFDILVKKGNYYFLEFNSAPTLSGKLITNFYRKEIIRLAKRKIK